MPLDHVNLPVPDVGAASKLFQTYFGFRQVVERGPGIFALLIDDSGFALALSNFGRESQVDYPGAFHIGFGQPDREAVDALYARLKADGLAQKPPREFHGAWTFYFQVPDAFLIEVYHQNHATSAPG